MIWPLATSDANCDQLVTSQDAAVGAAAPADLVALGAMLAALHTWSVVMGTLIFFGLGQR